MRLVTYSIQMLLISSKLVEFFTNFEVFRIAFVVCSAYFSELRSVFYKYGFNKYQQTIARPLRKWSRRDY